MIKNTKLELDLNDPAVIDQLLAADAVKQPTVENNSLEEKIKAKQKNASFSMKLSVEDIEILKRQASSRNIEWKDWLRSEIESKILNAKIGGPTINTPSVGLEPSKKITGPSTKRSIRRL